jgi:predicted kinase
MSKLYVLVGVPGSGKTTWISNQRWDMNKTVFVSTDDHVEKHAKKIGKTYNEVFKDYMPTAIKLMAKDVVDAREAGKDIVWDQTSTTVKSRARKFKMLPNYQAIAVVFKTPSPTELEKRLAGRPGKNIPWAVMNTMINGWEEPTKDEGFTEIWYV